MKQADSALEPHLSYTALLSSETVPLTISPVFRPPISVSTCLDVVARAVAAEKYAEAALYQMLAIAYFTHAAM